MKRIFALLLFVLAANAAPAQDAAVRVNALALATGTLNAGVDAVSYTHLTLPTNSRV